MRTKMIYIFLCLGLATLIAPRLVQAGNPNAAGAGYNIGTAQIRTKEISDAGVYTDYGYVASRSIEITAARIVANRTAAGTSQATTVKLQNGSTVIATWTSSIDGGTADLVAGRSMTMTLSTTAASLRVASGDVLKVVTTTAAGNNLKQDTVVQFDFQDQNL